VYFERRASPVKNPVNKINFFSSVFTRAKKEKMAEAEVDQSKASGLIMRDIPRITGDNIVKETASADN